jgi:hypothetical protein
MNVYIMQLTVQILRQRWQEINMLDCCNKNIQPLIKL